MLPMGGSRSACASWLLARACDWSVRQYWVFGLRASETCLDEDCNILVLEHALCVCVSECSCSTPPRAAQPVTLRRLCPLAPPVVVVFWSVSVLTFSSWLKTTSRPVLTSGDQNDELNDGGRVTGAIVVGD